ncbi:MAG: hypothetical protein ACI4AM_00405 [Muribaculaceae bacterium]
MLKSMIFKAMVMVLSLTACACLAACSDDNDPDDPAGNELTSISADYSLTVSDDYLAIYDIVATYSFDDQTYAETLSSTTWTVNKSFSTFPKHYTCSVIATPKASVPEYADEDKIVLSYDYKLFVTGYYKNGQSTLLRTSTNAQSLSLKGSKLADQVARGPRTILTFDYTR